MACVSKTLKSHHFADTLNQVPIVSKALDEQVFTAIEHFVEIRSIIQSITSKCAGELGKTI